MPSQNQKTLTKTVLTASLAFRDHLGGTRVKVRDCGEVVGEYDYLPYGGLASYCPPSELSNDYLFGGKELESAHNVSWYDSGARYQTTHGVFTSQDPLAEKYYSISPYAYCSGNPVNSVDVDGQMPQVVVGALIGATVEGVIAVVEGKTLREVGGAVVGGAIEGALASLTGGISMFSDKLALSVLATGAASAVGSAVSQVIGEGSIDDKQVAADVVGGLVGGAVSTSAKATLQHAGGKMADAVQTKYSSKAMISSVEKEVKKGKRLVGINPAGTAGKRMIMREVKGRISVAMEFELSIANAVKDSKVGDVTGGIVAHEISLVIYDKDE